MKNFLQTLLPVIALASPGAFAKPAPPSPSPEITQLQKRAAAGDIKSQLTLGIRYRDGRGVKQDRAEALKWYRMAADQGDGAGLDNVGFMHLSGWGVPKNWDIGTAYFKASARTGHAQGIYNLGRSYYSGQGVEQDTPKAIATWQRAAQKGHENATWRLAVLHAAGEGVPQDHAKAKALCTPLAQKGHLASLLLLGELAHRSGDPEQAAKWWKKAAEEDSPNAKDLLELATWRDHKPVAGQHAYVEVNHLYQGWNNCGPTSTAMLARHKGSNASPYDIKRLCPRTPIATGTDWTDLVAAGKALGQDWELITFSNDDQGFDEGLKALRSRLDRGEPVVIDFTVETKENGKIRRSGHTLLVVGYHAEKDQIVLKNPNQPPPGIQLTSAEQLKKDWTSRGYSYVAKGKAARPLIVLQGQ